MEESLEELPLLHDRDICLGCLARPSPQCACCGRAAVTAVRAGQCSISYCDYCALTLLMVRNPNAPPLVFLPLAPIKERKPKPGRKNTRSRPRARKRAA